MAKFNIYMTDNNHLCIVFQNSNSGWQYGIIRNIGNSMFMPVEMSTVSLEVDFIQLLNSSIFPLSKGVNKPLLGMTGHFAQVPSGVLHTLVKDFSLSMIAKGQSFYMLDDSDHNGTMLKRYLNNNFKIKFKLEDPSLLSSELKEGFEYDAQGAWLNIPEESRESFKHSMKDDMLYGFIQQSAAFKEIISLIKIYNPVKPFKNFLLKGEPAGGKTTLVHAIARYLNAPMITYTASETQTPGDLAVLLLPGEDTSSGWGKAETDCSIGLRSAAIVFFDEVNNWQYDTQTGFGNSIADGTRRYLGLDKVIGVHPQTIIFAAMNESLTGNKILNEAFEDRFHPIKIQPVPIKDIAKYHAKAFGVSEDAYYEYANLLMSLSSGMESAFGQMNETRKNVPTLTVRDIDRCFAQCIAKGCVYQGVKKYVIDKLSEPCYTYNSKVAYVDKYKTKLESLNQSLLVSQDVIDEAEEGLTYLLEGSYTDYVEPPKVEEIVDQPAVESVEEERLAYDDEEDIIASTKPPVTTGAIMGGGLNKMDNKEAIDSIMKKFKK